MDKLYMEYMRQERRYKWAMKMAEMSIGFTNRCIHRMQDAYEKQKQIQQLWALKEGYGGLYDQDNDVRDI